MFIHSASHGKIAKLRTRQADFSFLTDSIEGYTYNYYTPCWLKSSKKRNIEDSSSSSGGPSSNEQKRNATTSKKENKRGDKVVNKNLDDK